MDLMLALDSSCSIDAPSWVSEVDFVNKVVNKLNISDTQVHVGIVEFAKKTTENLAPTGDISKVKEVVSKLPGQGPHTMGCETHTDVALTDAAQMLKGGRKVPKVTIVVTDGVPLGKNHGEKKATKAANALKQQGVKLIGVGVGPEIAKKENADWLRSICSSNSDFFPISSWSKLDLALEAILAASCKPPPPPVEDMVMDGEINLLASPAP